VRQYWPGDRLARVAAGAGTTGEGRLTAHRGPVGLGLMPFRN